MTDPKIPDAGNAQPTDDDVAPSLFVGEPFVIGHDCELLERGGPTCKGCGQPAMHGAVALILCDCGQTFRVNLLANEVHVCPSDKCGKRYTSALVICETDNAEAFPEAITVALRANGYSVPSPDDDDEDDLGDDDDAGDDDDDDEPSDDAGDDDDNDAGEPKE